MTESQQSSLKAIVEYADMPVYYAGDPFGRIVRVVAKEDEPGLCAFLANGFYLNLDNADAGYFGFMIPIFAT